MKLQNHKNRVDPGKIKTCDTVHRHLDCGALFERDNITSNRHHNNNNKC